MSFVLTKENKMKYLVLISLFLSYCDCLLQNITEDIFEIAEYNNVTVKHSVVGLFDVLSGATKEAETLFDEFEEGFQHIQPINNTEELDLDINGTSLVVDLFSQVRVATKTVGELIGTFGSTLEDNKNNIEDFADNLEQNVGDMSDNVGSDFSTFAGNLGDQVAGIGGDITTGFSTFAGNLGHQVLGIGDDITDKVNKKVTSINY